MESSFEHQAGGFVSRVEKALSFRMVVPIALFSMIFVLALRQSVSLDPDLWWHLKAGEQIVHTGNIPHTDDFSFTKREPNGLHMSGCPKL
jgi:hypothetical protein